MLELIGYDELNLFVLICFDLGFALGGFFCVEKGTIKTTTCQFTWRLCKLPICLRDGVEMSNLICLYSIRSSQT